MKEYDLIIVGAGPAGMSAAIAAAGFGLRILMLEASDKAGKKILVTGNGKCNLTNEKQLSDCFRSETPDKVQKILDEFDYDHVRSFLSGLGIVTRSKNGYIYPYNEQAASVREAFVLRMEHESDITLKLGRHVDEIRRDVEYFLVRSGKEKYRSSALLLTTGGFAGPLCGCDGSGYGFAKDFGHHLIPAFPALTPLKSSAPFLKKASGVRNQARICLMVDGCKIMEETGELQWTDYGISGVAVFQLSRYAIIALEAGKKVALSIDFLPEKDKDELISLLYELAGACSYKTSKELLLGILPSKLVPIVLREARVTEDALVCDLRYEQIDGLSKVLKEFTLRINGYVGYEKAQVTRGGVSLNELTSSLESRYQKGLFFAGEILDMDGACGGYNLQWAFASGNVAGRAAAEFLKS